MDEYRKTRDAAPARYPWENGDVSAENLGATGVFGVAPEPNDEPDARSATQNDLFPTSGDLRSLTGDAPPVQSGDREGLKEPIVHKVVLGDGSGAAPTDLLSRLRANAAETEAVHGSATSAQSLSLTDASKNVYARPEQSLSVQASQGFTQLLRALGGDSSAAIVEQPGREKPLVEGPTVISVDPRRAESSFTSLLRTLNPNLASDSPKEQSAPPVPARVLPPSEGAGGFTAILQGFSETAPDSGRTQPDTFPPYESSVTRSSAYLVNESKSATAPANAGFTQLLSALNPEVISSVAAESVAGTSATAGAPARYPEHTSVSRSASDSSFTQLISTLGEPSPKASLFDDDSPRPSEDFSHRQSTNRQDPFRASQLPTGVTDWSRTTAPAQESASGKQSLTQLIRMMDEPSKVSENPCAYPTVSNSPASSPGGASPFTDVYGKLDERKEAPMAEPSFSYLPPSRLSATQPFSSQSAGGTFTNQWQTAPAETALPAGPSEVTRILDMSKMREMQRSGTTAPAQASPVVASPAPALASVPPTPSFQWQSPVLPAPSAGQPPHFGGAVQMPQYITPVPAPQVPARPAAPAMGNMQQYLPLLLIVIIFLLIVILVTVVFLVKH